MATSTSTSALPGRGALGAFRTLRRLGWALALPLLLSSPTNARAAAPTTARTASSSGRPHVELDRLEFPASVPGASGHKRRLESFLRREVRRADWGAGSDNRIEYRFAVTELSVERDGDVLRVRCAALGRLPGNRTAKAHLDFGGDPKRPTELVDEVLRIVARGVVTRLAELERRRRGLR